MGWFYRNGQETIGPKNREEIQGLVRAGTITDATLMRSETSNRWATYGQIREAARRKAAGLGAPQPSSVSCAECGGVFPASETIRFKDAHVCASCKPVFVQKLKEGVRLPNQMVYGGFWIRFVAKFIDSMVLGVFNSIVSFFANPFMKPFAQVQEGEVPDFSGVSIAMFIILYIVQFASHFGYNTFLVGRYSATLGKMACGLRVVTPEGERVGYTVAFFRVLAEMLSGIILMIGYIMAAFDEEKRTLHDRICGTRVIKKRS